MYPVPSYSGVSSLSCNTTLAIIRHQEFTYKRALTNFYILREGPIEEEMMHIHNAYTRIHTYSPFIRMSKFNYHLSIPHQPYICFDVPIDYTCIDIPVHQIITVALFSIIYYFSYGDITYVRMSRGGWFGESPILFVDGSLL